MARPRKSATEKADTRVKATRKRAAKASGKKVETAPVEVKEVKEVKEVEEASEVKDVTPAEVDSVKAEAAEAKAVEMTAPAEVKTEEVKVEPEAEKKATKRGAKPKAALKLETKKDTTKAIETKAGVLLDSSVEAETVEKKKPGRKPGRPLKAVKTGKPGRKPGTKKPDVKTEMFLQFDGKEFTEKDIFAMVKEVWTKGFKNKVGDLKDVKIYLKPEESAAYFVVNGEVSGKVDL